MALCLVTDLSLFPASARKTTGSRVEQDLHPLWLGISFFVFKVNCAFWFAYLEICRLGFCLLQSYNENYCLHMDNFVQI